MNEQSEAARMNGTCPSACCVVPIIGADNQPIGMIRFYMQQMPDDMAQVSYMLGTSYSLIPTVCIENGRARLVEVRIQHNKEG